MSNQQNHDKMMQLKLHGMDASFEAQRSNAAFQALPFDQRLEIGLDAEIQDRANRKLRRILKAGKLKHNNACPEEINYQARRGLDRKLMANLLSCNWIEAGLNILITGPTGVGKTWIACAIAQQAARTGHSILYKRLSRLLEEIEIAHGDGSLPSLRAKLEKISVLIIDDWALYPLTDLGRQELLEIVDDRYGQHSMIIASQLPIDEWHNYIAEPTVADALMDRIYHKSHRIELHGETMRAPMSQE